MTDKRSPYLDAFLGTVDFRDPASLLEAAAQLEATLSIHEKRIEDKLMELDQMKLARDEVYRLAKHLRNESVRLRRQEDFEEYPSFAEQNDGRIKGDSPNPE